jgi:hypothetical protein
MSLTISTKPGARMLERAAACGKPAWTHFAARATFVWLDFKPLYESALKREIAAMREAWAR